MTSIYDVPNAIIVAINAMLQPYELDIQSISKPTQNNYLDKRFRNIEEAAVYCGVSSKTIRRAIKAGDLDAYKTSDSKKARVVIDIEDLDKWVKSRKIKIT
jgi:excisionase family DNA binding protein